MVDEIDHHIEGIYSRCSAIPEISNSNEVTDKIAAIQNTNTKILTGEPLLLFSKASSKKVTLIGLKNLISFSASKVIIHHLTKNMFHHF